MGLDMYLNKMNGVKNWQHEPKETRHHVLVMGLPVHEFFREFSAEQKVPVLVAII
jgi:hypothetical protein